MIIIAYCLAAMFSSGVVYIYYKVVLMAIESSRLEGLLMIFIGLPMVVLVCIGPFGILMHERGPDLVTLKKSDWRCSASHVESVLIGKILSPQTVCDRYEKL